MKTFSEEEKSQIQKKLISWFQKNQRDLPWRKTYEPYAVWISEIMLQQTQVTTVLPYFKRWMGKLPTIQSVTEAKEDVILKLWEGLGYYSRARNLQKSARIITEQFNGHFPDQYDDILKLPGIGKYTAGAIASIAFNKPYPIVDGNVIRVLARLLNFKKNTRLPENVKKCWQRSEQLVSRTDARNLNQGMMELGAIICKPQNPDCFNCPLRKNCKAYEKKTMNLIPNRGEKLKKIPIKVAIAVIKKNGKIFIQKRPHKALMAGLWEFPGGKVETGSPLKAVHREVNEELGITIKNVKKIRQIKHGYTKFSVDLHCYSADFDKGKIKLNSAIDGKWVKPEQLKKYPFPAANVRLIADLMG
ncbi:A/G-specific adenine glycosylase [Candidatus Peregrinibacteria bacterium]|nr:A/G-specific adenine glycosylase [Candidatus Peregrinibacteria bacterium]